MSVDVQNLQTLAKTPIEEGTVAKKVELDKDDPLLRELEDLQTSEEQAFAHLQKLRLEACNIQRDEILTSSQYRELENSVTVMEDFVSKQFLELEMLLSQSGTAQGHLLGLANLFERKELDKQSKDRHDILHKIDQISFTKQYLADWRQDLNLRQLEKEYFGPVQEEEENFAEILQTQHEGFHIYLDYTARKEERLLAERNKLLTVDKEMQQRIRHLTGNKACSPPRPGGSGKEVDTGGSHQPEELVRLKRELAKAQSERDSLKFQLDLFKNNALNQDTGNTSVQDSLKKTRNEIENFSKLIRKLKHITNLKGTESSLMREASDRAKGMQTLITSLEKCGHNFDELTMQRNKLADMISEADNRRLFQYSQNMIQDTKTGDKDAHLEIDKNSDMISINELNNLINTLPELDEKTSSLVQRISKYQEKLQNLHIVAAHENIENIRLLHTTAIPNVQIDCYQKALDKINGTLKERTNDIAAEERNQSNLLQQIRHARESIDQIRRQGRHHPPIDEVILEEIRTYKQDLMCPSCQNNYKDAIIPNCGHVFCHQCLKQVSECPKCKTSIEEGGICKLYLV
ncbi:E3 ubiquitin-protein ligase Bre1 [Folsomia candida]|uniref:E3 ubiquitin-protein ligase Bre1 n=1 Tax=Folsomia candida TaxID=158441 RepID=UPI00160546FF|nr:E3 ubiquitin-protein ligase Bre1 [Folsomia candida]